MMLEGSHIKLNHVSHPSAQNYHDFGFFDAAKIGRSVIVMIYFFQIDMFCDLMLVPFGI